MWADNESKIDLINFSHFISLISQIIDNEDLSPCTIGVFGDWGGGKSSLISLTEKQLEEKDDYLVIKFNGWLFEGYEDAKITLLSTILSQVEKAIKSKEGVKDKADKELKKLWKRIDWLKIAKESSKGILKVATSPNPLSVLEGITTEEGLNKIKDLKIADFFKKEKEEAPIKEKYKNNISDFHSDFGKLLEKGEFKKIVVFIDDLDRCNPETIISTLEAIKLFLFVKNSVFVISADERIIRYAIQEKYPNMPAQSARMDVGRDYLEKLIQFPLRIPQLNNTEMEVYINLLFLCLHEKKEQIRDEIIEKVLKREKDDLFDIDFVQDIIRDEYNGEIPAELNSDLALIRQISRILTSTLHGNPRQCKRFLNMLMMRINMALSRGIILDKRVLAKIMVLEYLKQEAFRQLSEWQAEDSGQPAKLKELEDIIKKDTEEKSKESGEHPWLKDKEINDWLGQEPYLSKIDLRPYFYFSRDSLSSLVSVGSKMSPYAKKIFTELLSESDAHNENGLKKAKDDILNPTEVNSIFDALKLKIQEEPKKNHLKITIRFVNVRKELLSEFLTFIDRLPFQSIPFQVLPSFQGLFKDTDYEDIGRGILKKWSEQNENSELSKIAKRRLNR